jgi:nucleolar protein 56
VAQYWLLLESAVGYGLFEVVEAEEIGASTEAAQQAVDDLQRFSRGVKLVAFRAFSTAEEGLAQVLAVSEGVVTEELAAFVSQNMPKLKLSDKHRFLGVADQKLGSMIQEQLEIPCRWTEVVQELLRGARTHLTHYTKSLTPADMDKARLSLGHSYSRSRIKFNVHRQDNMIIQAIQLLDQLDKDVNTNAMRCREWYGWHFPELSKIVTDSHIYAKLVNVIQSRSSMFDQDEQAVVARLNDATRDEDLSLLVLSAAKNSMGMDVSEVDMLNVTMFASRVEALSKYRHELHNYLTGKMEIVAPNLNALLGEALGARCVGGGQP